MRVSFTGHRPNKLGTDYSITNERVRAYSDMLIKELRPLILQHGARSFISGGAIGIDQIAFWTVERLKREYPDLGIQNILSIPFSKQHTAWKNKELVTWYHKMIATADSVIYVDDMARNRGFMEYETNTTPVGEYHASKMQKRNEHMVDFSDVVVAVWDGSNGGTGNCVRYAKQKGRSVIQLRPLQFSSVEV